MIKKPSEIVNVENKFRVLIAGHPGIGKTTLGLSAPKPLLIDVDFGINRVMASARKDYIQPENYEELLSDLKGDLSDYETIVVDTGGKLLDLMKAYVIKQDIKNAKKDGTLSLQGYGAVGREFTRFMNYIYFELRKHCVIIFHAVEEKQDEETKLRILVEGSTKDNVWQPMDLGGFMEMSNNNRTIGFSNCERYFAKGTHGINGILALPSLDDSSVPNDFLTKLFKQVNQNILDEQKYFDEQKKAYEEVMNELVPIIENMTAETTEEVIEKIKNVTHVLTSEKELKHRFKEKVAELNLVWNKETKKYELKVEEVKKDESKEISNNTEPTE